MIKILLVVPILLIFSCGGDKETKNKFQDYKNKEIIIYNNISEDAINEYKNKNLYSNKTIQSFSNEIKCKDINPKYIQVEYTSSYSSFYIYSYSYKNFIACHNYDLSKTDYSGNKTYIINIGDAFKDAKNDDRPSFNNSFNFLFSKPKIDTNFPPVAPVFKK